MKRPEERYDIRTKGVPESLGCDMRKPDSRGKRHRDGLDAARGELDSLLREIEKEEVPERLLDLARQLQAALVENRKRQERERNSSGG